jgi:hypothetical protein
MQQKNQYWSQWISFDKRSSIKVFLTIHLAGKNILNLIIIYLIDFFFSVFYMIIGWYEVENGFIEISKVFF